jgi:ankyrin repeat protein
VRFVDSGTRRAAGSLASLTQPQLTFGRPGRMNPRVTVDAFLGAVAAGDAERARAVHASDPDIAKTSLHAAAALGDEQQVRRHLADGADIDARAGDPPGTPLMWLCYSPFDGLEAAARALLDAGADPNTRDGGRYELPALYAVTGHHHAPRIARMLLDAGADPNDGESAFHAAERFHVEALDLLLEYGADLNLTGEWGNTPLYFLLRYWDVAREERVRQGMSWLLDHGADPDVRCGREQETSLHVAARRGQDPEIVRVLLEHGADVHARRSDGRGAWLLATRDGHESIARLLEDAGAEPEPLSPADQLMAACGRGDAAAAGRLEAQLEPEDHRLLPEAASRGRGDVVRACLAAGFPVHTTDENGATALHHAAIHGDVATVRELLARGADTRIEDPEHHSTPLGWAEFGREEAIEPGGDYEAVIRALRPGL